MELSSLCSILLNSYNCWSTLFNVQANISNVSKQTLVRLFIMPFDIHLYERLLIVISSFVRVQRTQNCYRQFCKDWDNRRKTHDKGLGGNMVQIMIVGPAIALSLF